MNPKRPSRSWPTRYLSLAAVLAVVLVIGTRGLLHAHAMLLSAEPTANSMLTSSPARVRLVFSEPVDASVSGIQILTSNAPPQILTVRGDPRDVSALVGQVGSLSPGEHRVVWRTVSADGHKISGNFVFTIRRDTTNVGTTPPAAPPAMAEDSAAASSTLVGAPAIAAPLRGMALACMMALAGLLFFSRRATVGAERAARLSTWLSIAALVLASAHFVAWTINTSPDHRFALSWLRAVADTHPGHMEVARLVVVALAAWAVVLTRRPLLGLAFAASALVVSAAIGHPAAIRPLAAIPTNAVHLCAGAVWLGGLLWLISADRADVERYAIEARRVSSLALASVVLVVISGVAQTLLFADAPPDLFRSTYGKIVLMKVAGVLILIAFGAHHRFRLLPRLEDAATGGRLRDSVRFEVGVFLIVVLLGGLLAYVPPHASQMTVSGPPRGSTPEQDRP
jgi:copper transport protein